MNEQEAFRPDGNDPDDDQSEFDLTGEFKIDFAAPAWYASNDTSGGGHECRCLVRGSSCVFARHSARRSPAAARPAAARPRPGCSRHSAAGCADGPAARRGRAAGLPDAAPAGHRH